MYDDTRQLSAMLIPTMDDVLLIPGTVVAEIISWQDPDSRETEKPDWYFGDISWRGLKVPAVSFEGANNNPVKQRGIETRWAVMNGISGNDQLPFYALAVQGIPRTLKLHMSDVIEVKLPESSELIKYKVKASGVAALIPDLDKLEELLSPA